MKRVNLALALVPFLGLIGCAQQAEQEATEGMEMASTMGTEELSAAFAEIEAAWKQAYEGGDAAALASLYTADAIFLAPYTGATHGRAAIEARYTEQFGMSSGRQVTVNRTDQGASGDLSYGIGTYTAVMMMGDASIADNGKYITIAKRGADGSWKIHAHIWNTSRSEAEVAETLSTMAQMSEMSESNM